jgi:L-threonine kinase
LSERIIDKKDNIALASSCVAFVISVFLAFKTRDFKAITSAIFFLTTISTYTLKIIMKKYKYTGKATHFGTCGELVQGYDKDKKPFHVTLPINKTSTVEVILSKSFGLKIDGPKGMSKIKKAAFNTLKILKKSNYTVSLERWSDLHVGKGMGSSTADIVATSKAIMDAFSIEGQDSDLIEVATNIESSDGTMVDGMCAFNHKTGEVLHKYSWYPKLNICMIIPKSVYNTESVSFGGKEAESENFETILKLLLEGEANKDELKFAEAATTSAEINQEYLVNPYFSKYHDKIEELGAIGIAVGHTGTVCGILFASGKEGAKAAGRCSTELKKELVHDEGTVIELVKVV